MRGLREVWRSIVHISRAAVEYPVDGSLGSHARTEMLDGLVYVVQVQAHLQEEVPRVVTHLGDPGRAKSERGGKRVYAFN